MSWKERLKPGKPTPPGLRWYDRIVVELATVFGLGRIRFVGGALAAAAALPVWYGLSFLPPTIHWFAIAVLTPIGVAAAGRFDRIHESRDDTRIVIDEFVGVLVTMLTGVRTLSAMIAGLVLFGVLDLLKPPPIRQVERHVRGGMGVMGDDFLAGAIAAGLLWGMRWLGLV